MSTSLVTNYLNLHNAKQFRESISETANSIYYVFAGHHTPYANGDDIIPSILNTNESINVDPYKQMVFGKKVSNNDVKIMVPRYDWVSNTVYTAYRSNIDISACNFYAVVNAVSSFHLFKVLDNNGGSPSTVPPSINDTSADDEFYSTSDGYVWKYMYSIDSGNFSKFATEEYVPVIPNANVSGNAVSGAIDVIVVDYAGSNYNTYLSNTFISSDLTIGGDPTIFTIANNAVSSNAFYNDSYIYIKGGTGIGQIRKIVDYTIIGTQKKITLDEGFNITPDVTSVYEITPSVLLEGDGSGAIARALVDTSFSNTISGVEIIKRGSGYTYVTAAVLGNTGGVSNSASLTAVLGPKGGHGKDPEAELGGKYLGISVTFANSESGTIPVANDYRTIGLIKDPFYANVELTISTPTGVFTDNEVVVQANSNATGIVTGSTTSTVSVANVTGIFITNENITGLSSGATANVISYVINGQTKDFNTFDNRQKYTYTAGSGAFQQDEKVYQIDVAVANAYYHSNDANYYYLTDLRGVINTGNTLIGVNSSAYVTLNTRLPPDIVEGSGEVLYIENIDPIERNASQSESIKLILKF
jgi:hypothetical protein